MNFRLYFLVIALALFTISCHKDIDAYETETSSPYLPIIYQEVNGNVVGYVYDEENRPVESAVVQIYGYQTKTNHLGLFTFSNIKLDKQGSFVRVTKDGYLFGSDRIYPHSSATVRSYVKLFTLKNNKNFDASSGGTIAIDGGGALVFDANSIATASGADYNGKVLATAVFLDPKSPQLQDEMPGGLFAKDANDKNVALGTAGMFAVELRDEAGNELNLKSGSSARFSIPAKSANKPQTIKLWSFDEIKGWWIEEGVATLVDNNYTGSVSHFSFWNCDVQWPLINVCGQIVDENGVGLANLYINVTADSLGCGGGYTDENGYFCGFMPQGVPLTFTAYFIGQNCQYQPINLGTFGPFEQNTTLDPMVITIPNGIDYPLNGNVVCDGTPVNDAMLVVIKNGTTVFIPVSESGSFNALLNTYFCFIEGEVSVYAFSKSTGKTSVATIINNTNGSGLTIDICDGNCGIAASFTNNCNNTVTVNATGGSGSYFYAWSNGGTTQTVELDSISILTVTITDANDASCTQTFTYQNSTASFWAEILSDNCSNPVVLTCVSNGTSFQWSNGATGPTITVDVPTGPTTYTVTVTNQEGCTLLREIVVNPVAIPIINQTPISCNNQFFSLSASGFDYGLLHSVGQDSTGFFLQFSEPSQLLDLSVFNTGFNIQVLIYNNVGCQSSTIIYLPTTNSCTINNFILGTTNIDGNVLDYTLGTDCTSCTVGGVKIFNVNDLNTDLSSQNAQGLAAGTYYFVVTDANTGCYIYFKKFTVQ